MCVPGVHAHAVDGIRHSAIRASAIGIAMRLFGRPHFLSVLRRKPCEPREGTLEVITRSDAEMLSLPPNALAQVVQLVRDHLIDRLARILHVLADRLAD